MSLIASSVVMGFPEFSIMGYACNLGPCLDELWVRDDALPIPAVGGDETTFGDAVI